MVGRRQIPERPGAVLADDPTIRNRYISNIPVGLTESRPVTRTRANGLVVRTVRVDNLDAVINL
jgi:hypothetical protein